MPLFALSLSASLLLTTLPTAPAEAPEPQTPPPPAEAPRSPTSFVFSLDLAPREERSARMWTDNYLSAFRLGFWGKDALFDLWEAPAWLPGGVRVAGRAVELVALDFPLAILAQTFSHEIDGHGARVRELGGRVAYTFRPPFPYSMTSSTFDYWFQRELTPDETAFIAQGGLALEGYQRRQTLLTAFEAGTWSHGDAMLYFAWGLHLAGYGAREAGDVANWSRAMAQRYGGSSRVLRQRYLLVAALVEGLDPLFLYSLWTLGRFVALGDRRRPAPEVALGGIPCSLSTHLDPVPWGQEVGLDVLARTPWFLLDVAPRVGFGPGGESGGLAVHVRGVELYGPIHLSAEADLWLQPGLAIFPARPDGLVAIGFPGPAPLPARFGGAGYLELSWDAERWTAGLRAGGKSQGVRGVEPFDAAWEASLRLGLRLN